MRSDNGSVFTCVLTYVNGFVRVGSRRTAGEDGEDGENAEQPKLRGPGLSHCVRQASRGVRHPTSDQLSRKSAIFGLPESTAAHKWRLASTIGGRAMTGRNIAPPRTAVTVGDIRTSLGKSACDSTGGL